MPNTLSDSEMTNRYFEKVNCNLCNADDYIRVDVGLEPDVSATFFRERKSKWVVCKNCSLLYQNPRPNKESWSQLYESSDYRKITGGFTEGTYLYSYKQFEKVKGWFSDVTGQSISRSWPVDFLDYGCGVGGTLKYFRDLGCNSVHGIEVDQSCIQAAKDHFGQVVVNGFEDVSIANKKFDLIFTHHCLEHLVDMNEFFSKARTKMNVGGYLVIVLPSYWQGTSRYSFGTSMSHNFIVTHETLRLYLEKFGFQCMSHKYSYEIGSDREIWCVAKFLGADSSRAKIQPTRPLASQAVKEINFRMPIRILLHKIPEFLVLKALPVSKRIIKSILGAINIKVQSKPAL